MIARPTHPIRIRRGTAGAVVLVLTAALAACGNDDPVRAAPSDSTSSGPSASDSSGPSAPTTAPTSGVAPATGPEVKTSRFLFRAPEGFKKRALVGELIGSVIDLLPDDVIYYNIFEDHHPMSLDEFAQSWLDTSSYEIMPKPRDHTEIDGREVFHLAGPISNRAYADIFGCIIDGAGMVIIFEAHSPAPRRKEIVESTLATFRWR